MVSHTFGSVSFLDPDRNSTLIQNSQDIIILVATRRYSMDMTKSLSLQTIDFIAAFIDLLSEKITLVNY